MVVGSISSDLNPLLHVECRPSHLLLLRTLIYLNTSHKRSELEITRVEFLFARGKKLEEGFVKNVITT